MSRVALQQRDVAYCGVGLVGGLRRPLRKQVLSEVRAPKGNRAAVVFERSCGATTGFSTHVSVVKEFGELRKSAGNVFAADSDHGAVKDMTVMDRWVAPDQVVIRYPGPARVFKKEAQANGISVAYETALGGGR